MATEVPIYSTEPIEPATPKDFSLGSIGCGSLGFGGMVGLVPGVIWGTGVGLEVGAAVAGPFAGTLLGIKSSDQAEKLAKENRRTRAYVEAIRGSLEAALGWSIPGIVLGSTAGYIEPMIVGGLLGAIIGGGGTYKTTSHRLSKVFRSSN